MKGILKKIAYGKDADEAEDFLNSLEPSKAIPDRTFQDQLQLRIKNRVKLVTQWFKNIYHLLQSYRANIRYGFPAKKMKMIGVTGTYGKTTIAKMIYDSLSKNGVKVGLIATGIIKYGEKEIEQGVHETTPEPWVLPRILHEMSEAGVDHVIIEASSFGLDQHRLFRVRFDASVITNIDKAHLSYHKSWRNYAKAKFKLMKKTKRGGILVLNADHKASIEWLEKRVKNRNLNIKRVSLGGEIVDYEEMNKLMSIEVSKHFSKNV